MRAGVICENLLDDYGLLIAENRRNCLRALSSEMVIVFSIPLDFPAGFFGFNIKIINEKEMAEYSAFKSVHGKGGLFVDRGEDHLPKFSFFYTFRRYKMQVWRFRIRRTSKLEWYIKSLKRWCIFHPSDQHVYCSSLPSIWLQFIAIDSYQSCSKHFWGFIR